MKSKAWRWLRSKTTHVVITAVASVSTVLAEGGIPDTTEGWIRLVMFVAAASTGWQVATDKDD